MSRFPMIRKGNEPLTPTEPYRKTAVAHLEFRTEPFSVPTKEGVLDVGPHIPEWENGYWLCWPSDGDPYPISPQFVRDNYELAPSDMEPLPYPSWAPTAEEYREYRREAWGLY